MSLQRLKNLSMVVGICSAIVTSLFLPILRGSARATDTGGYPWANAVALNQHQYDWGYSDCLPPMQSAGVCAITRTTPDGRRFYVSDPWRYALRNCTSYVAWRVNNDFGVTLPPWGNANTWDDNAARQGRSVTTIPQTNDIAVWEGAYGHVAFVTAVNEDGTVNVDQYNQAGTGQFSRQSRVRAHHYIHLGLQNPVVAAAAPAPAKPVEPPKIPDDPATPRTTPIKHEPGQFLSDTSESSFSLMTDPKTDQTQAYAVDFANTKSGRVELSRSKFTDGNATWEKTWTTPFMVHTSDDASYVVVDHDADGILDLMQIKHALTTSGQTEVSVVTGKSNYKVFIATWRTNEPVESSVASKYSVADFDGDGAMDLVKLDQQKTSAKQRITILSGAKQYGEPVGTWKVPVSSGESQLNDAVGLGSRLVVGDDDRDGKPDILSVPQDLHTAEPLRGAVYMSVGNYVPEPRIWRDGS